MQDIPVVDRWDYDEIMITGGEPMLYPKNMRRLLEAIREIVWQMGRETKIYLYTSRTEWYYADEFIRKGLIDGIVVAPHSRDDLMYFRKLNNELLKYRYGKYHECSLRLKVFPEVRDVLPDNLNRWQVDYAEWIENCPLPDGEDFRRVAELWTDDKW